MAETGREMYLTLELVVVVVVERSTLDIMYIPYIIEPAGPPNLALRIRRSQDILSRAMIIIIQPKIQSGRHE